MLSADNDASKGGSHEGGGFARAGRSAARRCATADSRARRPGGQGGRGGDLRHGPAFPQHGPALRGADGARPRVRRRGDRGRARGHQLQARRPGRLQLQQQPGRHGPRRRVRRLLELRRAARSRRPGAGALQGAGQRQLRPRRPGRAAVGRGTRGEPRRSQARRERDDLRRRPDRPRHRGRAAHAGDRGHRRLRPVAAAPRAGAGAGRPRRLRSAREPPVEALGELRGYGKIWGLDTPRPTSISRSAARPACSRRSPTSPTSAAASSPSPCSAIR